jgi:hypothetical protein
MLPVAIIKSKVTFKTPYYECYEQDVNFGDFSKKYYVVDFNRTAAVICVNENNEVLITRQYRLLLNRISFEIAGGKDAARKVLDALQIVRPAVSFGGPETLICHPASSTHIGVLPDVQVASGITDSMLRLSIGLEATSDIVADLQNALK